MHVFSKIHSYDETGLILDLHPANEKRRDNVTPSLIGGCKPRILWGSRFQVNYRLSIFAIDGAGR